MTKAYFAFLVACFAVAAPVIAQEQPRKSVWKKLFSEPELPTELQQDVDVFKMARSSTPRNPLSFAPFRVTKLHTGVRRTRESASGTRVGESGRMLDTAADARQKFSFTLEEDKQPQWEVSCATRNSQDAIEWEGRTSSVVTTISAELALTCDLTRPESPRATLLFQASAHARGLLGADFSMDGRLRAGDRIFDVKFLYLLQDGALLGDVPAGYAFVEDGKAVAAIPFLTATMPNRFVAARFLSTTDRSLIAAASAALTINQRLIDADEVWND